MPADFPYDREHDAGAEEVHRVSSGDRELGARRCRSCKALVLWTVTESGELMPVDFAPSADGTIAIKPGTHAGKRVWRSRVVRLDERGVMRRKSHFASCPNAPEWRKRR
ncbi:MAG: hypothetical protein K8H88_16840 [Sandaracinaceae bacterium]|nr:hypothetical protein [Sandaracinaceae bacterium]